MSSTTACGCATRDHLALESLLRPEFFCGQLLTDADLTALTAWVRNRLRLAAQRTGWGVVCGLAVVSDAKHPSQVIVRPGVAVSPCGQDILVPANDPVDLSGAVPALGAPCDRPASTGSTPPPTDCVVDIGVRYQEQGRLPVLGVGRGDCAPPAGCVDSRMNEGYEVVPVAVTDLKTPPDGGWATWRDGYVRSLAFLRRAVDLDLTNTAKAAEWLKDRWRETPQTRFPRLGEQIDAWPGNGSEEAFAELLFLVAQDRVLTYLELACLPACPAGGTDGGTGCGTGCGRGCGCDSARPVGPTVPLARVWLHNDEKKNAWVVTAVDDQPPFRRLLTADRPAPPAGGVNLGHVIWRDRKDAARLVRQAGVGVAAVTQWSPTSASAVRDLLSEPPATAEDDVTLLYAAVPEWAEMGGLRAVGFGPAAGADSVKAGGSAQAEPVADALPKALAQARPRRTHARVPVPAVPDPSARRRTRPVAPPSPDPS